MPSVLVEAGFISNEKERLYLESTEGKETISNSIFKAFSNYKSVVEQKNNLGKYRTIWAADSVKPSETLAANIPTKPVEVKIDNSIDSSKSENPINKDIPKDTSDNRKSKSVEPAVPPIDIVDSTKKLPDLKKDSVTASPENHSAYQNPADEIWFTVQVTISAKPVNLIPDNFKGEKNITCQKMGGIFKYFSGRFKSYSQAQDEKNRLKSKFQDAFIVAFLGDKPIPVKEAIQKTSK
jgi:N-acetylmuramoyl-L-alanine amidase